MEHPLDGRSCATNRLPVRGMCLRVGRDDLKLKEMGAAINSRMGLNTWAAFFGNDANAEVAGDVAMLSNEVTPVLKALRANGLDVVAIHHHMTGTQPSIYFLHYWGTGPAERLATGFRAALNGLGKSKRRRTSHSSMGPNGSSEFSPWRMTVTLQIVWRYNFARYLAYPSGMDQLAGFKEETRKPNQPCLSAHRSRLGFSG
jgi:Domain of Unknown Function (DUF1259)